MGWDFHKTNLARDATIPNNWESGKNSSLLLLITGIAISANSIKDEVTEATVLTNKPDGFPTWRLLRGPTWHLLRFFRFPPWPPWGSPRKSHVGLLTVVWPKTGYWAPTWPVSLYAKRPVG